MTELEFRKDKAAVEGLVTFLATAAGLKFLGVIKSESILNKLSSQENQTARGVRDLPLAETGSADNLLGRCIGYNVVSCMIERLQTPADGATDHKPSRASVVSKAMSQNSDSPTNKNP